MRLPELFFAGFVGVISFPGIEGDDFVQKKSERESLLMTLREHDSWVTAIACSPAGKFIVSGSSDDLVILWDAMQGKPLKKRKVPTRS